MKMLKGVLLVRFDYKLGPVAEAMFPEGFIPRERLWNAALDVWVSSGAKDLSEAKGCTQALFHDLGMIACIYFGEVEKTEYYAIAAFFDSKKSDQAWHMLREVEEILKDGINKLRDNMPPDIVAENIYYFIGNLIAKKRFAKAPAHVIVMFRDLFSTLSALIDIISVLDEKSKRLLLPIVEAHIERLAELALFLGGREVVRDLIRSVMEKLT
ncbi:MAG: hypothetical protein ACTSYM_12965 [Candidatus Baldrarchaeia archaeon]